MTERFERTKMLIGDEALKILQNSRIAVFGAGGVGGYAIEALARSGVGALDIIDADTVNATNLNRQIIAAQSTVGRLKTEVFEERIKDIAPDTVVRRYDLFYLPEKRAGIPFAEYDYIIDAVDTVAAKLDIIEAAYELGIPVISAMGCGNRLDPSKLQICDISKTSGDPLAKIIRKALRDKGIKKLDVVFSTELPVKPAVPENADISTGDGIATENELPKASGRRSTPSSMVFVPACAGLMMASHVVRKLTEGSGQA